MSPTRESSFQSCLLAALSILGIFTALLMVFGQSQALGAVQSSNGTWIEICGGEGTRLVQIEGKTTSEGCAHCNFCAVQFSAVSAGLSPPFALGSMADFTCVEFFSVSTNSAPGAEQYWAANRGPPLTSEENMKINSALPAAMTTLVQGGISWL